MTSVDIWKGLGLGQVFVRQHEDLGWVVLMTQTQPLTPEELAFITVLPRCHTGKPRGGSDAQAFTSQQS